jgi:tetratricopeptide (TPR) repeat protein
MFAQFLLAAVVPVSLLAQTPDSGVAVTSAPPAAKASLTPEDRGDIFMARKMFREAIDQYRQMPETAPTLNKIGIAYHQTLDLKAAQRYYERAIKRDPHFGEAVNNLGAVYYAEKRYGRALHQYEKAVKLSPNSASIYSNLGTAHFARKEYSEAFEAYQHALKLDPEVFSHHSSYGVLLQETDVAERARYHYFLAKMYAQAGMLDQALQCIRKSLEEGFKERDKFIEDPEFAVLKDNEEYKALMAQEPRAL